MGLHKAIETPEKLWELFEEYEKWAKNNPLRKHDFVGKDGDSVHRELERPLTIEGFSRFCYKQGIIADLKDYFGNTDNRYEDFKSICSHIKGFIRADQIEGGMAGIYNPSITQRLNGLVEKTQTDLSASINILNVDPLDDSTDNGTP